MNAKTTGPFQLPPLPWSEGALDPVISSRTIGLHYGKHHKTYVDKLNEMVAGTRYADMPLERVAQVLEIPVGTVYSRLHHAMRAMRASLDADARPARAEASS